MKGVNAEMPGLLGPTNPVPGYEPTPVRVTTPPPGDTTVQNIVDPNRVVRPDNRPERQDTGDAANAARYESNFMTFLQRLRGAGELPSTFMRVMGEATQVTSGIRSGFAEAMSGFLEFLSMDEEQLLSFLRNQLESGSRFGGALFEVLRSAFKSSSELTKSDILQFLRRFSDFSSTEHLEGKLLGTVEEMSDSLPSPWSGMLSQLLAELQNGVAAGDRAGNLKLLREQLFPTLAKYVSMTHDHGRARSLLSMLTLDMARYENGSEKGLLQSLRHLAANGVLPRELGELGDNELMRLLKDTDFTRAASSNSFADTLAELTGRALRGEGGASAQEAFQNILTALLINESVYMPVNHVMLPLNWNGNLMFSELWVDPDAERDSRGGGGEPVLRVLIKMDIQSLGAFDVLIDSRRDTGVSLSVACPQELAQFTDQFKTALGDILAADGLKVAQVEVGAMARPVAVSDVFPKIFGGASGVNVRV